MIKKYFRTLKDDSLKEITDIRNGVWVYVESPTEEEITELEKNFGLDDAILADAQDFFEVPRLEQSGGVSYFFTRYPFEETQEDGDTAPLLIAVGESFVVTVALRDVPQLKAFIEQEIDVFTTQKAKFFLQIMTVVVQSFEKELVRLRRVVQRDRTRLRRIGNQEIVRLVAYEHRLNDMVAALVPTNLWLEQLSHGGYLQLFNEDIELMEDLSNTNRQVVESARAVLKDIQNIRSASATILTNNLNTTIKTLTILTIILTIPTVIASLFGMNVAMPFADHPYGFWLVLTLVAMTVSLAAWLFFRNNWLK